MIRSNRVLAALAALAVIGVGATWYVAATQLGHGLIELVPFTASGAVLGLFIGWLTYSTDRPRFTWNVALACALAGGVILPPWLGTLIAITGTDPSRLLVLFTSGAWVALAAGLVAATLLAGAPFFRRRSPTNRRPPVRTQHGTD